MSVDVFSGVSGASTASSVVVVFVLLVAFSDSDSVDFALRFPSFFEEDFLVAFEFLVDFLLVSTIEDSSVSVDVFSGVSSFSGVLGDSTVSSVAVVFAALFDFSDSVDAALPFRLSLISLSISWSICQLLFEGLLQFLYSLHFSLPCPKHLLIFVSRFCSKKYFCLYF